jgi:excisionase family DNA binding protein
MTKDRRPRPQRRMLTVNQIADADQVSPRTVRRWIASGRLPCHRLGLLVRVSDDDHEAFLAQHRRR